MHRVVLDTSIIVAALRSRTGAANAVMRLVARRRLVVIATPALFLEYEDVLKRSEQQAAHGLDASGIDRFLAALASAVEPIEVHFHWRPQLTDPSDEMVLEAAVNGRADALVTHNVRDFAAAAARFGLRVAKPAELPGPTA
ncbi:MAG TPA: putative toxin-antitoxin system toxin component, PIN family [Azospirillaceae bacterium]|nr:putative toxin-antitoxin system toxin component, PIN family [Azospirillaceae bacterium]